MNDTAATASATSLDDDALFERLLEQVATRAPHPLLPELSLFQAHAMDEVWEQAETLSGRRLEPPFWAFVWPGGLAVARFLLDRSERVRGRRVLDLATGDGVIALATALTGGQVTANDVDPLALRMTALHARLHSLQLELLPGDLLESDPAELPYDLITVGDAFYEQPFASRLFPWLQAAHRAGKDVVLGDPGRNFLPASGLREVADYPILTSREIEGRPLRHARVFTLSD